MCLLILTQLRIDMATATWNGAVIARSDETITVEGNHYFPPESVNTDLLQELSLIHI